LGVLAWESVKSTRSGFPSEAREEVVMPMRKKASKAKKKAPAKKKAAKKKK
jgi:hypothetical protein